jgi:hypothetical protein
VRKRFAKILTNNIIVRKVFGNKPRKKLAILGFIDNYNYYIGGVDLANQFRKAYKLYRATLRIW